MTITETDGVLIATDIDGGPLFEGKSGRLESIARLPNPDPRSVYAMPTPLAPSKGVSFQWPNGAKTLLRFPNWPSKPSGDPDPFKEPDEGDILRGRIKRIWARLREVDEARADPASMWKRLRDLWLDPVRNDDPRMDVIVRQARRLRSVLDRLDRSPRRILRRVHKMTPLARVQELDRSSISWLVRQSGATKEERAGDRQRIRAVAREENFDTLENRAVLSYARLALEFARDYQPKQRKRALRPRELLVRGFGKRCAQLASDLSAKGVRGAPGDIAPNFVLQNNPDYRAVWDAWRELLAREPVLDELWRWQARSWEEFCALALTVALQAVEGAETIATSPIVFRKEQERGRWIICVTPLAVIYLPRQDLIVEVQYREPDRKLAGFGAAIWLRAGALARPQEFLARVPVWPVWNVQGGLVVGETSELDAVVARGTTLNVKAGVTIRPNRAENVAMERGEKSIALTLGDAGAPLQQGLEQMSAALVELLQSRVGA